MAERDEQTCSKCGAKSYTYIHGRSHCCLEDIEDCEGHYVCSRCWRDCEIAAPETPTHDEDTRDYVKWLQSGVAKQAIVVGHSVSAIMGLIEDEKERAVIEATDLLINDLVVNPTNDLPIDDEFNEGLVKGYDLALVKLANHLQKREVDVP